MNPGTHTQLAAFLDAWLAERALTAGLPGFTIAIRCGDHLIYNKAYGYAHLAHSEAMRESHLFNIGSQAKMFTATAVMQLVEQGKLALDEPAGKYLPWLYRHKQAAMRRMTTRELLAHEAGIIRDGLDADYWQFMHSFPDALELRHMTLQTEAVEHTARKVKYSNLGYALLGQIIEAVSGVSYAAFITQQICKPLGLMNTYIDSLPEDAPALATGYSRPLPARLALPGFLPAHALAAVTGIYSTPQDLTKFIQAHALGNTALLNETSKGLLHNHMRHEWMPLMHRSVPYAHGFYRHNMDGHTLIGHGGAFIGHASCTFLDPVRDICIAVCVNAKDAPQMDMQDGLWGIFNHFERDKTPLPVYLASLNRTVKSLHATLRIEATSTKIIAASMDTWLPLRNADELRYIDETTLKIARAHDLRSAGELVHVPLDHTKPVRYAGVTMLPPKDFDDWAATLSPG